MISSRSILRIASVSYLNARPLIEGLEKLPDVRLSLAVPSKLLDLLKTDQCDAALLPVIDYQRLEGLTIVPAGGIGSDGPTLTVRIFSRVPIGQVRSLACDTESHTSVALARMILAGRYGLKPEFCDLSRANDAADQARLLIGDKVVCDEPKGFNHQLDLGSEWKVMTGRPFVFAVWMARGGVDTDRLHAHLRAAKQAGMRNIDRIIAEHAIPRGWPAEPARDYLTRHIQYDVGNGELDAISHFHQLAYEHGIIGPPCTLRVHPPLERAL